MEAGERVSGSGGEYGGAALGAMVVLVLRVAVLRLRAWVRFGGGGAGCDGGVAKCELGEMALDLVVVLDAMVGLRSASLARSNSS